MQKLLFIFIFILGLFSSCNNKPTEKKNSLNNEEDSIRISKLCDIAYEYEFTNLDTALILYDSALKISNKIQNYTLEGNCNNYKGIIKYNEGNYEDAITLYHKAILEFNKNNDNFGQAKSFNNIANAYNARGVKLDSAAKYYQLSINKFENIKENKNIIRVYFNYAGVLRIVKSYSKAISYLEKAVYKAQEYNDTNLIVISLVDLSLMHNLNNDIEKSDQILQKAIDLSINIKDDFTLNTLYQSQINYFIRNNDMVNAEKFAKLLLKTAENTGITRDILKSIINLCELYTVSNKIDKAKYYCNKALKIAIQNNMKLDERDAYRYLNDIYTLEKNYKQANYYALKYIEISESIVSSENNKTINELEAKYQNAKKEAALNKKDLELLEQKAKIKNQNFIIISISIGIMLLAFILFLIKRNFNHKQLLFKIELEKTLKEHELKQLKAGVDGEEKERTRLASELHDGLCGVLSGIKLNMSALTNEIPFIKNNSLYNTSYKMLDETIKDVRKISHDLMPTILYEEGLNEAIKYFCKSINISKKLNVQFEAFGEIKRLNPTLELTLYRITQELLQNAIKHSEASNVYIQLSFDKNNVLLTVEDNGKGFIYNKQNLNNGIGLGNLISRIEYLNGTADIDSVIGKGTSINITINLQQ